MLHCQFLCHVLKALFFTKIALKLCYLIAKKCKIFGRWKLRPHTSVLPAAGGFALPPDPHTSIGLGGAGVLGGAPPPDPQISPPPPLRISGYAPVPIYWKYCITYYYDVLYQVRSQKLERI